MLAELLVKAQGTAALLTPTALEFPLSQLPVAQEGLFWHLPAQAVDGKRKMNSILANPGHHRTTPSAKQALSAGAPQHPSEAKPILASFEPEFVYFQLLQLYAFCSSTRL